MNHLTLDEFRERSAEYDAAVAATPEISNFCNSRPTNAFTMSGKIRPTFS